MKKFDFFIFDLDGTLLDTAKDFYISINILKSRYSLDEENFEEIRNRVSEGSASLVKYAMNLSDTDKNSIEIYRRKLLSIYEEHLLDETNIFDEMQEVLTELNKKNIEWGIVTNKPKKYADKIVSKLLLSYKPLFLICPEDVGVSKPDPKGIIKALSLSKKNKNNAIYIGDHIKDIQAGSAAKVATMVAAYGYLNKDDNPLDWQADFIINSPKEIHNFIK
tara:strand:+ start:1016 stop:1675 length:660 start_codon:yes stop_codon:yes gene_type:complete